MKFRWDEDPEEVATQLDSYKLWRNADLWKREGMFAAGTLENHITQLTNETQFNCFATGNVTANDGTVTSYRPDIITALSTGELFVDNAHDLMDATNYFKYQVRRIMAGLIRAPGNRKLQDAVLEFITTIEQNTLITNTNEAIKQIVNAKETNGNMYYACIDKIRSTNLELISRKMRASNIKKIHKLRGRINRLTKENEELKQKQEQTVGRKRKFPHLQLPDIRTHFKQKSNKQHKQQKTEREEQSGWIRQHGLPNQNNSYPKERTLIENDEDTEATCFEQPLEEVIEKFEQDQEHEERERIRGEQEYNEYLTDMEEREARTRELDDWKFSQATVEYFSCENTDKNGRTDANCQCENCKRYPPVHLQQFRNPPTSFTGMERHYECTEKCPGDKCPRKQ